MNRSNCFGFRRVRIVLIVPCSWFVVQAVDCVSFHVVGACGWPGGASEEPAGGCAIFIHAFP